MKYGYRLLATLLSLLLALSLCAWAVAEDEVFSEPLEATPEEAEFELGGDAGEAPVFDAQDDFIAEGLDGELQAVSPPRASWSSRRI